MSVVLLTIGKLNLDRFANDIGPLWIVYRISTDSIRVKHQDLWFRLVLDEEAISEYDDCEIEYINNIGNYRHFYHLIYSCNESCNAGIMAMPPSCPMLVDNDYGVIAKLSEIRQAIGLGIAWQTQRGGDHCCVTTRAG